MKYAQVMKQSLAYSFLCRRKLKFKSMWGVRTRAPTDRGEKDRVSRAMGSRWEIVRWRGERWSEEEGYNN